MPTSNQHALKPVESDQDWDEYHRIRRTVLFAQRGLLEYYDPNHPDEYIEEFHPLLLTVDGKAIGTVRLDEQPEGHGIVRLVAIDAPVQRQGHGQVLMDLVEEKPRTLSMPYLEVNAAPGAVPFYEKLGYVVVRVVDECADESRHIQTLVVFLLAKSPNELVSIGSMWLLVSGFEALFLRLCF